MEVVTELSAVFLDLIIREDWELAEETLEAQICGKDTKNMLFTLGTAGALVPDEDGSRSLFFRKFNSFQKWFMKKHQ